MTMIMTENPSTSVEGSKKSVSQMDIMKALESYADAHLDLVERLIDSFPELAIEAGHPGMTTHDLGY